VQTALIAILAGLGLVGFALLWRYGMTAGRRIAGRAPLAVPVCAMASHPRSRARVGPAEMLIASRPLRAPPTLPAHRRRVKPGIFSPD
jgi:hypothetical protein